MTLYAGRGTKSGPPSACWYCTVRVRNYSLLISLFFVLQSLFQQNHCYFLLQAGPSFSFPYQCQPYVVPKTCEPFRLKARFLTGGLRLLSLQFCMLNQLSRTKGQN
jgi:hypothetical protein